MFEVGIDGRQRGIVENFLRRAVHVPADEPAFNILRKLRAARVPLAVVEQGAEQVGAGVLGRSRETLARRKMTNPNDEPSVRPRRPSLWLIAILDDIRHRHVRLRHSSFVIRHSALRAGHRACATAFLFSGAGFAFAAFLAGVLPFFGSAPLAEVIVALEEETSGLFGGREWHAIGEVGVQFRGGFHESRERGWHALILLADFFDDAGLHQILELFIGAQAEHFFPSDGRVSGFQVFMDHEEQRLELERSFRGQHSSKLLRHPIWTPT